MNRQRWIQIAARIAIAGAAAWLVKFVVVAATEGDESTTASVLYLTGVLGLLIGSTWVGATLAGGRSRVLLAALVLVSPLAVFVSYAVLDSLGVALTGNDDSWIRDELGIAFTAAVWLAITVWALRPQTVTRARRA